MSESSASVCTIVGTAVRVLAFRSDAFAADEDGCEKGEGEVGRDLVSGGRRLRLLGDSMGVGGEGLSK